MRKRWWVKALLVVFILPWATPALPAYMSIHWMLNGQWGMLNNLLWLAVRHRRAGLSESTTGWGWHANIGAYIWKNMPFWTIILLAGRMAIPQELYEAAAVDGATGLRKFAHVTYPADGEPLSGLHPARHGVRPRRLQRDVYFVSGGGPAMSTEVLATLGIRYAFTVALPRLGVAAVMSALPVLIPLVIILMRKLRAVGGTTMSATTSGRRIRPRRCTTGCSGAGSRRCACCSASCCSSGRSRRSTTWFMIALDSHDDVFSGAHLAGASVAGQLPGRGDPGLLVPRAFLAPVRQQLLSSACRRCS